VLMSLCGDSKSIDHLLALNETGVPVVFFDRVPATRECPTVTTDDFESGFNATEHLINAGCSRIGYLRVSGHLSITQKRMDGYLAALKKNKLPVDPKLIVDCTNDNLANVELLKVLLKMKNRPDGIFASVEKLAISTYYACNEIKIKIPQQLKIISFSNLRTASLLSPSLATITQPTLEIGKESAAVVCQMIEKKNFNNRIEHVVMKSNLIERNSSKTK